MDIKVIIGGVLVFAIVAILVVLASYLMKDSGMIKEVKEAGQSVADKMKEGDKLELINAPIIYYKSEGEKKYQKIKMLHKKFTIGSGPDNDLILDDKKVEKNHAVIQKKVKGTREYYEFVTYAKTNLSEYCSLEEGKYWKMRYKDGIELETCRENDDAHRRKDVYREIFYVGETKIVMDIPIRQHGVATEPIAPKKVTSGIPSERIIVKENELEVK